mmetsp:Transcript_27885/g.34620  ORF Transcript_27885/g.34620 Transcript_27885/m.34620 type:complete len:305 (+) Transcript_27885:2083-2997(+)
MGVQRRDRVVHDQHVGALVDGAGQSHSRLLPARKVDALLADLSCVARRHDRQVGLELAGHDGLHVLLLVEVSAEEDVFAQLAVLDPGLLLAEAGRAVHADGALGAEVGGEERVFEVAHFALLDGALVVADLFDRLLRHEDQLANHGVEEGALAGASRADDDREGALLDLDVEVFQADDLLEIAVLERDGRLVLGVARHLEDRLANAAHVLRRLLVLLFLDLLANLVFFSLVELGGDAVGEVALDGEGVGVVSGDLVALDEAFLALRCAVELPELLHALHHAEVLAVEVLCVVNSVADTSQHDLG